MESKTVRIPNITCGHCVGNIRREISDVNGVVSVEGEPATKQVTICWSPPATWKEITEILTDMGYPLEG